MYYTMTELQKKLNRSVPFINMVLDRFGVEKRTIQETSKIVIEISEEQMKDIIKFNISRKKGRNAGY